MEEASKAVEDELSGAELSKGNNKVGLVYDEGMTSFCNLWVPTYPECPNRVIKPLERCVHYGLVERCHKIKPRRATKEEVLRKHSREYYEFLERTAGMDEEELKSVSGMFDGIYFHHNSFDAAMLSAGCAIESLDSVLKGEVQCSFALIRPPGHHAMREEANGYCYLNNVALAAAHALEEHGLQRILVIDWDVHHGQGTQSLFYDDPRVLYFSAHRYEHGNFWPNLRQSDFDFVGDGEGEGFNVNVPINEVGIHDSDFLAIHQQLLMPIAFEFQPEVVLVSCGFDAAIGDPESLNHVTPVCFAHLTHMVKQISNKICFLFEGGYCLKSLSECTALTLKTLLGDPCPQLPPLPPPSSCTVTSILNSLRVLRPFWKCFQYQVDDGGASLCESRMETPKEGVRFNDIDGPPKSYSLDSFEQMSLEDAEMFDEEIDQLIKDTFLAPTYNRTCIAYSETMLQHKQISGYHPERPDRATAIMEKLKELGLLDRCKLLEGRKAELEELNLVHDPEYTKKIEHYTTLSEEELDELTTSDAFASRSSYICKSTFECGSVAVGCALNVVDEVVSGKSRNGFAVVRPPGHHAEKGETNGFCFWNTIAIAAKYCQKQYKLKRILIVDWDVHHGNGTQSAFYSDRSVLVVSVHRRDGGRFYPTGDENSPDRVGEGEGVGFNVNVAWPKGRQGDAEYMAAFQQVVMPAAYEFGPDVVLVSAGFDAALGDPLGGCCVSPEMYGHMTYMLSSLAGGRLILVLEGGYNLNSLSISAAACVSVLLGDPLLRVSQSLANERAVKAINEVIAVQKKFWKSLAYQVNLPPVDDTLEWLAAQKQSWESNEYKRRSGVALEFATKSLGADRPVDDATSRISPSSSSPSSPPARPPPYSILSSSSSSPESSLHLPGASRSSDDAEQKVKVVDEGFLDVLAKLALGEESLHLHAVQPLAWCPHLDGLLDLQENRVDTRLPCLECGEVVENWMCLSCSEVYCSRFRNGHMVKHSDFTKHPLVLSFSDLSVWCYQCEAYVDNQLLNSVKDAACQDKFHSGCK